MESTPKDTSLMLSISLIGHCCLFLNLKELQTTQTVSHRFHQATRSEAVWNENSLLPSFHHTTFPSPRIQLRSTTHPLIEQLDQIRSSPHSLGHSARWLEVSGSDRRELKEIQAFIKQESTNLDGLIIRKLNHVTASMITATNGSISPSTKISSLRILFLGGVLEDLLIHLLPIITAIHSLQILELELALLGQIEFLKTTRYDLPPLFASSLIHLKELQTLILSDPSYRRQMGGFRPLKNVPPIILSNTSLNQLNCLVDERPQLKLELCLLVECATDPIGDIPLSSRPLITVPTFPSTPLSSLTTLAIAFDQLLRREVSGLSQQLLNDLRSSEKRERCQQLFTYFPNLTAFHDLSQETNWTLFDVLPTTIINLAIFKFTISPGLNPPIPESTNHSDANLGFRRRSQPFSIRRMTVHHLFITGLDVDHFRPSLLEVFGSVEEFHSRLQIQSVGIYSHIDLYRFMPKLRVTTFHWPKKLEQHSWETRRDSLEIESFLVAHLPSVTKLEICQADGRFACAYEARTLLRTLPHLKEVKWNDEPWLPLDRIESYYSWESIDQRLKKRLNLDRLDQIQPILQQINTAPLPPTINLNLLSLTLIFQFLTPMDLFSAHRVCRSYRVAAVSPLVLRPNIRVRMDHEKGVIVSGTQVSFTSLKPMLSAVRSMLFQNIRILSLGHLGASEQKLNPRLPTFYSYHLNRFQLISSFHSLHTLALDWSVETASLQPSSTDAVLIDRIFQTSSLNHLKVLRLKGNFRIECLESMLNQWILHLRELTVVELRVNALYGMKFFSQRDSLGLCALNKLPSLKEVFLDHGSSTTTSEDLDDLLELTRASDSIETIVWYPPIEYEVLQQFTRVTSKKGNQPPIFTRMHSIKLITPANDLLPLLDAMIQLIPNVTAIHLTMKGRPTEPFTLLPMTLVTRLCHQLTSLEIHGEGDTAIRMILEVLNQPAGAGLVWSRLEEFGLFKNHGGNDYWARHRQPIPTQLLSSILPSMTRLSIFSLEGINCSLDLEPLPWMGRLRVLRHSDREQLERILPYASQLTELFASFLNLSDVIRLLPPLHTIPQFRLLRAVDGRMTRHELIQCAPSPSRQIVRTQKQRHRPSPPTSSTSFSTPTPGAKAPVTLTATTIPSAPTPSDESLPLSIHLPLEDEIDQLAEILMELADSFQTNNNSISSTSSTIAAASVDDRSSNDERVALAWMKTIESDGAKIRKKDIYPRLQAWLTDHFITNVLDIGAGQGACAGELDLGGRIYTGVDPSPRLIARAKELYGQFPNLSFELGNLNALPFPDESFGGAFSVAVWHLLSDLTRAASELNRVLTPGGHFIIITANPDAYSLWTNSYTESRQDGRRFEGKLKSSDGTVLIDVLYLYTLDELLTSLRSAGLTMLHTMTFREKTAGQKQFISIQGKK